MCLRTKCWFHRLNISARYVAHGLRMMHSISTDDFVDVSNSCSSCSSTSETLGVTRNPCTSFNQPPLSRLGLPREKTVPELQSSTPPIPLQFDDDEYAEKILEMEAEGAIEECWQDSRKAYFDDVKEIARILKTMKVRDICCVDTSAKTANFDYIMFGSCEGSRHIHLAAWAVQESDQVHRISKIKRRKTSETWEVVPVGRILVNLMTDELRVSLSLERKWAVTANMDPLQAANASVSEGRYAKAHGLWTLTLNLQDLEDFEVDYCKDTLLKQW